MTRALTILQRVRATDVDRCKDEVARLVAEGERLAAMAHAVRANAIEEANAAAGDAFASAMIGAFVQDAHRRANAIEAQRREIAAEEALARDALSQAFLEEKKVVLLLEAHATRARAQQAAREASEMDEIAITRAPQR